MGFGFWKCVVPNCITTAQTPSHLFPRNETRSAQWLNALQIIELFSLNKQELSKCKVCHLHFQESDYIFSLKLRRLKQNAILHLNINSDDSGINVESVKNDTQQSSLQYCEINIKHGICQNSIHSTSKTTDVTISNINPSSVETSIVNAVTNNITSQAINEPEANITTINITGGIINSAEDVINTNNTDNNDDVSKPSTSKSNSCISHISEKNSHTISHRPLLSTVTRAKNLCTEAKRLYNIATILRRKYHRSQAKIKTCKERLNGATSFYSQFMKDLKFLTPTQLQFFEMQIKNARKKLKEQKRAAAAEQQARGSAMIHEARVIGLEARLAELSEIVGSYDRLRQQDQLVIQKLKEQLVNLQDTEHSEAVTSSNQPEEIISKIKALYTRLLDLDNKKKDSLYVKSLLNSLDLRDEYSDYKEKYDVLLQEFEDYKHQVKYKYNMSNIHK